MPSSRCWSLFLKARRSGVRLTLSGQLSRRRSGGGGWKVITSHISEGKDFFEYEPESWDILISNPPFSKKDEVLRRVYQLGKPFALLLPANSIQGKKRFEIFNNDVQMLCFDSRIDYHTTSMQETSKGNCFASAYFCRGLLPSKLELRRLVKYQKPLI